MNSLEEKIKAALASGAYDIDALEEASGLSKKEIYSHSRQNGIDIKRELQNNYTTALIHYRVEKKTAKEIAVLTKKSAMKVNNDLCRIGLRKRRNHKTITEEDISTIKRLEKSGLSIYQIADLTGRADGTVKKYLEGGEEAMQKILRKKERDERIRQGLSLGEIAAAEDVSRQAISHYIHITGQYKIWRKERDEIVQTKPTRKKFLKLLGSRAHQLLCRESWAYAMTQEYHQKHRRASLDKTMKVYEIYMLAKMRGEKPSTKEIASQSGCSFQNAVKLLSFAGCRSLFREHDNCPVTTETMIRLSELGLSEKDIGAFCNINNSGVALRFRRSKYRPNPHILKRLGGGRKVLTYRRASEIYEAADLGYTTPDICELLDTHQIVVDYALKRKEVIAPVLIHALRMVYPECETPYISGKK